MEKKPLSNNSIPTGAIWAFGIIFLTVLFALPFALLQISAATRGKEQSLMIVGMAGLPIDSRTLRPDIRETEDKNTFAARYELSTLDSAKVAYALPVVNEPSRKILEELGKLASKDGRWLPPISVKGGPWHEASGEKSGTAWHALFDESHGVLWIHGVRLMPAPAPAAK